MSRLRIVTFGLALLATGIACARPAAAVPDWSRVTTLAPVTPAASPPPARWVAVSVATLWVKPGRARAVDAPAGANPADPRAWVAGMTVAQKRWLVGRLETQALYGTRVYLLGASGAWSKVAVAGQPTPRNVWGYPGWVPTRQLTATAPATTQQIAVVRKPTAWLWEDAALTVHAMELSYGTRLPLMSATDAYAEVATLDGGRLYVRRSAVALHTVGAAWPKLTGAALVAEAKRFLGLQYLWAGTSGFGFDCSGFTYAVYRTLGTTIPRDAGPQFAKGTKIASRAALRPGDLVFFRSSSGATHHVGMYVGGGKMIHSPGTGLAVRLESIRGQPYFREFAGGRRYR